MTTSKGALTPSLYAETPAEQTAAARLGASTAMLGAVGEDVFGETLRGVLKAERVDASGVKAMRGETTGVAVIQVAEGDNAITGAAGANALFSPKMVVRTPRRGEIWVAQFETPVATTAMLFAKARAAGLDVVMDRCVKIEHARLFGGLNWAGVNTRVISAKRPQQLPY